MSRPVIVVGDKTSHGGVVISGSPFSDIDGKAIARIGDKVTCPQKGHGSVTVIVTGDQTAMIDGSPVARHGDQTACGATLISSQMLTYVDYGSSAGGATGAAGQTGTTSSPASNNEKASDFDQHFLVTDEQGNPLADWPYKIKLDGGEVVSGRTDVDGKTQKIASGNPENATFHVFEPESTPINPFWDRT